MGKCFDSRWAYLLLPASNGKLEHVFSTLTTIKVDKSSRLMNESLDDLLLLKSSDIPLTNFNADPSNDLWWSDKNRRPSQKVRKAYKPCRSSHPDPSMSQENESSKGSEAETMLEHWDEMINTNSDKDD